MFMGPPIGCEKDSACIYHSILSCPGPINCKSNSCPINGEKSCDVHHQYWLILCTSILFQISTDHPTGGGAASRKWPKNLQTLNNSLGLKMGVSCSKDIFLNSNQTTYLQIANRRKHRNRALLVSSARICEGEKKQYCSPGIYCKMVRIIHQENPWKKERGRGCWQRPIKEGLVLL